MPGGSSLRIDNVPATDPYGYAGLQDKLNFYNWKLAKGVALSILFGLSVELYKPTRLQSGGVFIKNACYLSQTVIGLAASENNHRRLISNPSSCSSPRGYGSLHAGRCIKPYADGDKRHLFPPVIVQIPLHEGAHTFAKGCLRCVAR